MAKVLINDSTMTAIADSIRNKTGKTDKMLAENMPAEIDGIESGGGAEVYYSDWGQQYTPHMVIPNGNMRYVRDHFKGAVNLITYVQQYGTPVLDTDYGLFHGCTSLERAWVARSTFGMYCFTMCTSLKELTLGRVGLPVTTINSGMWSAVEQKVETITCYVNAEKLADIPTSVTNNIVPIGSPNVTMVYRNSTTGEVITE